MRFAVSGLSPLAGRASLRLALVASLAVTVSGCFQHGPYPGTAYVGAPQRIAHMPVPPRNTIEMEDDGLPVQRPPTRRATREADDPTQPWSPNYGKQPAEIGRSNEPKPERAPYPTMAPVKEERPRQATTKPTLPVKPARFDADAVIAKAIAMHEVYNPR